MIVPGKDQIRKILESAILAPSADNHHSIRFEVDNNVINVWSTKGSLPPPGGYKRILALLSLGALSENLTIAATRYGLKAEPELFPDPARPDLVFQVRWQPNHTEVDPLWEMIPLRHTNRRVVFHGPKLPPEDQSMLESTTSVFAGCNLVWLDGSQLRRHALHLMRLAESERFRNRLLHEELFSAIRFDVGWHASCDEGLPPGALAIEPPLRPAFALLRHWPVMKSLNLLGGYHLLGLRAAYLPCRLAPHLGAITIEGGSDRSVFDAGRAFQRLWLTLTYKGYVLQPMPASALYALEGARMEGIPAPLQQRLRQGWQEILPGKHPIMLFRIGRTAPLSVNARRKPLESYSIWN